jgi:Cu/Ag efflux protein CusF
MGKTMTFFHSLISCLVLAVSAAFSLAASAQDVPQTKPEMTAGEIRKVDKEASKITIKHSEIKSLDMPPMTMVFTIKDPALLETTKAGDKVKFTVVREDGKFVVTEIQPDK